MNANSTWQYVGTFRGFSKFGIKVHIVKATASGVLGCLSLAETANRADSGQLQFWSEPSEILNLRSSNTPETVAFTIPWYQTWWNPYYTYLENKLFHKW